MAMNTMPLGLVVAIRELYDKELSRKVVVKIGKPRRVRRGEWICPYVVIGLDSDEIRYVYGIDAVQALLMSLEGARATLEGAKKELRWVGGDSGDTGFPRAIPTFFGSEFSRKLDLTIEKEVRRFARAVGKRKRGSAS